MLTDELFAKTLRNLETCLSVSEAYNNNFYWKFVSSFQLPITFHERFKVDSVPHFIPTFNLLS